MPRIISNIVIESFNIIFGLALYQYTTLVDVNNDIEITNNGYVHMVIDSNGLVYVNDVYSITGVDDL